MYLIAQESHEVNREKPVAVRSVLIILAVWRSDALTQLPKLAGCIHGSSASRYHGDSARTVSGPGADRYRRGCRTFSFKCLGLFAERSKGLGDTVARYLFPHIGIAL